jgi:hypothetical protein
MATSNNPLTRNVPAARAVIQGGKLVPADQEPLRRPNAVVFGGKLINVADVKEPKYTFGEAMGLAKYGYTGLFGRSKNKKTVGLLGENWQQQYALSQAANNKAVPTFSVTDSTPVSVMRNYAAATIVAPGTQPYNSLNRMYTDFAIKYGADGSKFVKRYGAMPSKTGKYGILFNTNNKAIRNDDVLATYQNDLSTNVIKAAKWLMQPNMPDGDKAYGVELLRYSDYKLGKTARSKPNKEKIAEMESVIAEFGKRYSPEVEQAVGGPSSTASEAATSTALSFIAGPLGAIAGSTTVGNDLASRTMDYMSGLSEHNILKGRKVYWGDDGMKGGIDQAGIIGLSVNTVRGLARFGLGLPAGIGVAADETGMAISETVKVAKGEKEDWGEGVDFKLGDAMWADYARRYYDPFAYQVDKNGNYVLDEEGNKKFQGFWNGMITPDNYNRMGEEVATDPLALALDVLDVVPVIGFAAKGAAVASVGARTGRIGGGLIGVTKADKVRLAAADKAIADIGERGALYAPIIRNMQEGVGTYDVFPAVADRLSPKQMAEARTYMDEVEAKDTLDRKFAMAPSARNFRKTVRAAINGNRDAIVELDRWKSMGMEFNGAENSWTVRLSAQFEPRSKVLETPESIINASDKAIVRLPASPLVRGIKEGWTWIGRKVEKTAQEKVLSTATPDKLSFKIATKLIDMPRMGYRWNYSKAVQNEIVNDWGDTTSEMTRASKLLRVNAAISLSEPMRSAIENELFGGTGELGMAASPSVQRQALYDKLAKLPRDSNGEVVGPLKNDEALYLNRIEKLLDPELSSVDKAVAAKKFDEDYQSNVNDLRARIADPEHKAGDVELDEALTMYRGMLRQDEAIRNRLVHEDMTPTTLAHLKLLYSEAMLGLRLTNRDLFGKDGKGGRLGGFTKRVLRPNNALGMYLTRLVDVDNDAAIIDAAQDMDKVGTIFDDLEPDIADIRKKELVTAVKALVNDNAGIFRDGQGGSGDIGRPVIIMRKTQDAGPNFVQFHIPRLRHTVDNGTVKRGKLVDEGEVFTMPKVFFASKDRGRGKAILEPVDEGKQLLETGALNGMADVYPNARFYSEKVSESGRNGTRMNEKMVKNEGTIANSALREHSLAQAIRSQVNFFVSRVERDIGTLAESQAVLIPASRVNGVDPSVSGYRVLSNVMPFDNIEDARVFAKQRGVEDEFEKAVELLDNDLLEPVTSTIDVAAGMGIRIRPDGSIEYIVRGGVEDWTPYGLNEDLNKHSALVGYKDAMYMDPIDIPNHGYVLAVPNAIDKQLSLMAIRGDDYASRLLSSPLVKGPTNIFKWLVLNMNPKFISNNVIGGITMLMINNPASAVTILMRTVESIAKKNGDTGMSNIVRQSEAVNRQLQYEFNSNIYRRDSGVRDNTPNTIRDLSNKHEWFRKYVQNFGYTTVSGFEEFIRRNVAVDYLKQDAGFNSFTRGPEVEAYIKANVDWNGAVRAADDPITPFEAAVDLLLDRNSPYFNAELKHSMRYTTNTVSGNYHRFSATEQLMRNFLMPFYAWQRHSVTYTYRMMVDKPITSNVLYNVGQYGYVQAANSGVPDYAMMTIPAPNWLKEMIGMEDSDFRIDANALSPFSTTGDMAAAAIKLLTGTDLGSNVFEFTNPYINSIIKDTLGVDPQTGRYDFSGERSNKGILGATWDMGEGIVKGTYLGRTKGVYDAIEGDYEKDALANKYATIDNAIDILRNKDDNEKFSDWKLYVPEMRSMEGMEGNVGNALLNLGGVKTYRTNMDAMDDATRAEMVGAYVINKANESQYTEAAQRTLNGVKDWQRKRDYVMDVWLPVAEAQGLPEDQINLVIAKIRDERPDSKKSQRLLQTLGG